MPKRFHLEPQAEPERTANGTHVLASGQVRAVGAIEGVQIVVVATEQIRRHGELLKILAAARRQHGLAILKDEGVVS